MLRRADVAPLGRGKVLHLTGSPREQGRQLGRGAAELIRENLLSDHAEPPLESVCRHGGEGKSQTYAAIITCPQDRTMWATIGNPCEGIQAVGRPGE